LFIPLGLVSGVLAGWKKDEKGDNRFRSTAFIATSLPPFVLALILISVFYVGLRWFPPERLGIRLAQEVRSPEFEMFTGLMTVDGLLNGRSDISLDALRHLVLPVITLSLLHWATLGRVMRASVIEESYKDYVVAGKAHGLKEKTIVWKHIFRNSLSPALTSSALAAASLFTGVFIVEVIYNFKGVSDVVVESTLDVPDAPAVLGFAVYSVTIVLLLMLALDIIQALLDPRVREGML
jgi:peptide/nickel transport system permease protein